MSLLYFLVLPFFHQSVMGHRSNNTFDQRRSLDLIEYPVRFLAVTLMMSSYLSCDAYHALLTLALTVYSQLTYHFTIYGPSFASIPQYR